MSKVDFAKMGKVPLQPGKAVGPGAPKAVYRLIRVPNGEQALPFFAPLSDQLVLQIVDVLEFIYQQMGKPAEGTGCIGQRPQKKIVKIQQLPLGQK